MPMIGAVRHTSIWGPGTDPMVEGLCKQYGISKSALLEILVLGMEGRIEMDDVIARGRERRKEVNPDRRKQRGETMSELFKLPKDELDRLLELSRKSKRT